jgi:hypothetical protein
LYEYMEDTKKGIMSMLCRLARVPKLSTLVTG